MRTDFRVRLLTGACYNEGHNRKNKVPQESAPLITPIMTHPHSTCWTIIESAAAGSAGDRDEFARRHSPVVRSYLASRWRSSPCLREIDDAVQEVFVECFKQG